MEISFRISFKNCLKIKETAQIPVAARSEASVCDRLISGIAGSNPAQENGYIAVIFSVEVANTANV
jgi:hypothetical protein